MQNLKDKLASGEIVGAVARSFSEHGARVYVTARNMPGADQLLLYPFIAVWLVYFLHFFLKKDKKALDILKVLMLLGLLALPPLIMRHLISEESREMFVLINSVLFWCTFLYFLYDGYQQKMLFRQ